MVKQIYFNLKSNKEKEDMLKILMGEQKAQGGRIGALNGGFMDDDEDETDELQEVPLFERSDEEVEEVVRHLKAFGPPNYMSGVIDGPDEEKADGIDMVLGLGGNADGEDTIYDEAVSIVLRDRKCSTSYIQRKLSIGYNKAARLVEQMEEQGLVSTANHVGKREILVPEQ